MRSSIEDVDSSSRFLLKDVNPYSRSPVGDVTTKLDSSKEGLATTSRSPRGDATLLEGSFRKVPSTTNPDLSTKSQGKKNGKSKAQPPPCRSCGRKHYPTKTNPPGCYVPYCGSCTLHHYGRESCMDARTRMSKAGITLPPIQSERRPENFFHTMSNYEKTMEPGNSAFAQAQRNVFNAVMDSGMRQIMSMSAPPPPPAPPAPPAGPSQTLSERPNKRKPGKDGNYQGNKKSKK